VTGRPIMPRERLARLRKQGRLEPQRSPDDLHKAAQEAKASGFLRDDGNPKRAAQGLLSARERRDGPTCMLCDGRGSVYSEPDLCGDQWLEECGGCEGSGKVRVR
jgi:DnaJ-class molecular chaperone